jgi:alkylhydroperoxidase family enzyme
MLLEFAGKITFEAYKITRDDTDPLRSAGWSEEQIAEAVYIAAMFAFFNRVADAFGIEPMGYMAMGGVTK